MARGAEDALAELYDRFGGVAYGVALRILRDPALAQDAVQDAFLAAWRTAAAFDPARGNASTWLLTLVHRRAVDLVRREERRRADVLDVGARGVGDSTDEAAEVRAQRRAVQAALAQLPADQREALSSPTTAGSRSRSSPSGSGSRSGQSRAGCSPHSRRCATCSARKSPDARMLPLFDNIPTRRLAVVSYALIGVNVLVWVWELSVSAGRIDHYAFYPCAVQGPCVGPARDHLPWAEGTVSSMFLHASWLHLLGNMLFLWIFANNVEDVMGRFRFLVFYFAAGFAAALTQTVVTLHFSGTAAASIPTIGASGAIAGVLGAYFVLLPHARVVTLLFGFLPVPLSAMIFLGVWFVFQLWQGGFSLTHPDGGGGVAFAAHVGGFVLGMLAVRLFQVRAPLRPRW